MNSPFLTFVLLDRPANPNLAAVVAVLRSRHPELVAEIEKANEASQKESVLVLRCGNQIITVASMPTSLPEDSGLWSRAERAWPGAHEVAKKHRGHLIVSILGRNQQSLARARLTTAVVGALIATMPQSCAVVWDGKIARPAAEWRDLSELAYAPFPDYPYSLWLDVLPYRTEAGIGAVTVGLSAFVEREIEFETSRLTIAAMIEKVCSIAVYLIEHGPVLKDGDTIGEDAQERILVRHGNSDAFDGLPVFFCTDGPS